MGANNPAVLISELETINEKHYEAARSTVNNLVDVKVALHRHDKILDDQIEDFTARIGIADGNINALTQQNGKLQTMLIENVGVSVSPDNISDIVYPQNAYSAKLIKLQAKNSAIDDAMNVVKKSFEKDHMDLGAFLKTIRSLASKQARQIIKMRKLLGSAPGGPQ